MAWLPGRIRNHRARRNNRPGTRGGRSTFARDWNLAVLGEAIAEIADDAVEFVAGLLRND